MKDFEQVLDDSLDQIARGAATAEDCLAQHPEYAAQLGPLLQTAARLERGRRLTPPAAYKTRARDELVVHMQAHPRRHRWKRSLVWNVAISLAVLVVALILSGTAFAQGSLPGQPLYQWKLSSEQFWRASSPDRVGVDLQLANRRAFELTSVSTDANGEATALAGYQQVLDRLSLEQNAQNDARIMDTLKANQLKLSAAGIKIPALDKHLGH